MLNFRNGTTVVRISVQVSSPGQFRQRDDASRRSPCPPHASPHPPSSSPAHSWPNEGPVLMADAAAIVAAGEGGLVEEEPALLLKLPLQG